VARMAKKRIQIDSHCHWGLFDATYMQWELKENFFKPDYTV